MSLSTLRMNFYRIASLIIDHGAESMRCLLDQFIQKKYRSSFRDYVSNHQHEIYHHFSNGICCLCSKNERRTYPLVISAWQMEKLFDKNSPKLSKHKYSSKCDYCCSTVKSTLLLQDIDITLLRFFLVTYFAEEFWQSCFTSGIVFHDFLNTHKHDIFHLLQLNTPCCICIAHPEYTTMVLNEKDRLNKTQWETMFHTSEFPCIQHRNYCPDGYTLNPCSVSATIGIRPSDLDGRARKIILSKFCTMMRHIDGLVNARNTSYAHAIKGELSNEVFRQLWDEIENSIVYISNITSTVDSRKLCILELREKSLEESMCLELQCFILKQIHGDEQVLQACGKIQDTFEMVKEVIAQKLQQINLQITAFTSSISDVVRNELSVQLNEYSDRTRNIIDNTRREIESHNRDTTYIKTSAVTTATEQLDSYNLLILYGRAGSGKTSTALEIASLFHVNGYIIMKLEQNLAKDFKTYFISKNKQLIIFEDLFGKADIRYNEDIHSNLLKVLKPHVANGVSKFIITVRSYKSEVDSDIATYHQLLSEAGVLNLNGKSSLSNLEKERILTMHAAHNELEICSANMQKIVASESYLGFPEACRLFCSFAKFFKMGHLFFTSPTKVLENEISVLKTSIYSIDPALQYCVLICLMIDYACKDSFCKNIHRVAHDSNCPSNNYKNINCSVIEYLYHSLFDREIRLSIQILHRICKTLTNSYIKIDINSDTCRYVFQHQTVFEVVLSSYWHAKTMEDVIKYFKVDIIAEYIRPFDSIVTGYKKYLIVPMNKCTDLTNKLFKTFLENYNDIFKCYSLIQQSKFILKNFNAKVKEWFQSEKNVANCNWYVINYFIRPTKFKIVNGQIGTVTNDDWLIQRLIDILMKSESSKHRVEVSVDDIERYTKEYGCEQFVNSFNEKLAEWFQSEQNVANCKWDVIHYFIRPTSFKIKNGKIGSVTNDDWLIQRIIDILMKSESSKHRVEVSVDTIKRYTKEYGCEQFVNSFNEKLAEWFQSEQNVANCKWDVIDYFIRPTSFKIENGKIGSVTNDDWLIQRIIDILMKSESSKHRVEVSVDAIKRYTKEYGCEQFVKSFNEKLAEWFQSEQNVANCKWDVIDYFIRPTSFKIENGKIGSVTNDDWLIQRIIDILMKSESSKHRVEVSVDAIKRYTKEYGCEQFVNSFNEKLAEWFQSEQNVANCKWDVIHYFIRPTSFKIENGKIGSVTNDDWLIQRIIDILMKSESSKHRVEVSVDTIKRYTKEYGCEQFVNSFNEKLAEWFQSEQNVANCKWDVIHYFIRPTSFKIENGKIGSVTNDDWLIQRIIDILMKSESSKHRVEVSVDTIKRYTKEYGCEQFVNSFNEKLAEWFQSEQNVANCKWDVIDYFIRPTSFKIENGKIGSVTNDDWLIQRLIDILMKSESSKHRVEVSVDDIKRYTKEYGCEQFVNSFNEKLAEWFQSEQNVANCKWDVIDYFIRPTSFKIENGKIGSVTNDDWLIQRIIDILMKSESSKHRVEVSVDDIERYTKEYGCEQFVNSFNEKLAEWFQSEQNVANCEWYVIDYFIRPTSFKIENGKIGSVTNDDWLIQRLIDILMKSESSKHRVEVSVDDIKRYTKEYGCEQFVNSFNEKLAEWFQSEQNVANCKWDVIDYFIRPTSFKIENGKIGSVTNDDWLIQRIIDILMKSESSKHRVEVSVDDIERYTKEYGCEQFVNSFNEKLAEWFQSEQNVANCEWYVIDYFIRPTSFKIENSQICTVTNDGWLIQRLIHILMNAESSKHSVHTRAWMIERYIKRYGCEEFVISFNIKLAEWFQSEENVANCEWPLIDYFIRPTSFKIENSQICSVTNDDWLIQRLIHILMKPESSKDPVDVRARSIHVYISEYGCEEFVNSFKKKLAECIQAEENVVNCNLHLFTSFVRPQSWLCFEKIGIYIQDERVVMYLFSKLEQPKNINAVKSYIRRYGTNDFITNFNEHLKKKVERNPAFDQQCTWECLERFFDNVASSDANDILNDFSQGFDDIDMGVVTEIDSSISIDTNSHSEDSETDSNIDVDSSNSSEDSESDSNIDVDSSNSSEDSESDSNIDVDSSNQHSDNETSHQPSSKSGCKNGVLIMKE